MGEAAQHVAAVALAVEGDEAGIPLGGERVFDHLQGLGLEVAGHEGTGNFGGEDGFVHVGGRHVAQVAA